MRIYNAHTMLSDNTRYRLKFSTAPGGPRLGATPDEQKNSSLSNPTPPTSKTPKTHNLNNKQNRWNTVNLTDVAGHPCSTCSCSPYCV